MAELYINAFMGHSNHQGQDYSELSKAKLELEYLRVEPFLTVYGEVDESLEIKEDVKKLERRILDLNRTLDELQHTLEGRVEEITRRLFEKWMDEYTEELKQARLDFTKRYKEEVKKPSPQITPEMEKLITRCKSCGEPISIHGGSITGKWMKLSEEAWDLVGKLKMKRAIIGSSEYCKECFEKQREEVKLSPKEKISKIEEPTEEEPKPSPKQKKRPLTWREEILGEENRFF